MKPSANNHKRTDADTDRNRDADTDRNRDADTDRNREEGAEQQHFQQLVEALMERTGQPRSEVEQWVNGAAKMLRDGVGFYDVSRSIGSFIASKARRAKPYVLKFGRSVMQSLAEEQRLLQAARLPATDGNPPDPVQIEIKSKRPKLPVKSARNRQSAEANRRARPHYNPWACPTALKQEAIMIVSQPPFQ